MSLGLLVDIKKDHARLAMEDGSMRDVPISRLPKGVKPGMDIEVTGKQDGLALRAVEPPKPTSAERTADAKNPRSAKLRGPAARQQYVFRKLVDSGWSEPQAAGITGRFMQESGAGLDPNAKNPKDPGTSEGLGQWNRERKAALRQFAAKRKTSPYDLDTQIDFFNHEIKSSPSERIALAALQSADTPEEASIAMMHYERPAGYTARSPEAGHGFDNTVANARQVLGDYDPSMVVDSVSQTMAQDGLSEDAPIDAFEGDMESMDTDPAGDTLGDLFAEEDQEGDGAAAFAVANEDDSQRMAARRQDSIAMMNEGAQSLSGGLPGLPTFGDVFGQG